MYHIYKYKNYTNVIDDIAIKENHIEFKWINEFRYECIECGEDMALNLLICKIEEYMNDSKKRYIKECYLIVKAIDCLIEPTIKICRNRTTFPKE